MCLKSQRKCDIHHRQWSWKFVLSNWKW